MYLSLRKFANMVTGIMSAQFLCFFFGTSVHFLNVLQNPHIVWINGLCFCFRCSINSWMAWHTPLENEQKKMWGYPWEQKPLAEIPYIFFFKLSFFCSLFDLPVWATREKIPRIPFNQHFFIPSSPRNPSSRQ